jgi:hypothetical protein
MQTLRAPGRQATWLVIAPLILLSGCVYPDDRPYGYGTYGARPENCGTPYEPKSCSEYSAPPTGYQYTQPGPQYAPPQQYAPSQYPPPQYPPQQQFAPPQYPPQQYGSPTTAVPNDPYGRETYAPPPTPGPEYAPSYPPPGSNGRDDDGPNNGR